MFGLFKRRVRKSGEAWRDARLFAGLSDRELEAVEKTIERRTIAAGETIVEEGDPAEDLFLVAAGSAEVLKKEPKTERQHRIGTVEAGEVVGELALFDKLPRSASVRAVEPCEVVVIPFQALRPKPGARNDAERALATAYHKLVLNMAGALSSRMRAQADESLASAQRRTVMGQFVVNLLILLCAYVFLLEGLTKLGDRLPTNTSYVSIPLQVLFGVGSWMFIRGTGYPLRQFGIGFNALIGSFVEAVVFTVPVLALLTGVKWISMKVGIVPDGQLVEHPDIAARLVEPRILTLLIVYSVSSAVQELIVRGALQSSLEMFLTGPRRVTQAIMVSALLFSVTHLHMSFAFAALAFLPGLFWGWLFARRRNLLGVTLSHIAVGGYVFFIMGVRLQG